MRFWLERATAVLVLALAACDAPAGAGDTDGDAPDPEGPWEALSERPCPPESFLSYENFGGPFVINYCRGCHSSGVPADMRQDAPTDVNFDDIEAIRTHAPRMWLRASGEATAPFDAPTMPPAGAPDAEERALLGEWLACGAPTDAELGI